MKVLVIGHEKGSSPHFPFFPFKTNFLSITKEEIAMKSLPVITMGLLVIGLTVLGCSQQMSGQGDAGWVTLLDGSNPKTLDNWNRIGDANWRAEDGAIVADKGKGGHLVSKNSYKDFQIRAEFWADQTTNSGIFIRIADPNNIARPTR